MFIFKKTAGSNTKNLWVLNPSSVMHSTVGVVSRLLLSIQNLLFKKFLNYIPNTILPPTSPSTPLPTSIHFSQRIKPPMRKSTMPGTLSSGRTMSVLLHQGGAHHPSKEHGFQKASSCTRGRCWSHCQGPLR